MNPTVPFSQIGTAINKFRLYIYDKWNRLYFPTNYEYFIIGSSLVNDSLIDIGWEWMEQENHNTETFFGGLPLLFVNNLFQPAYECMEKDTILINVAVMIYMIMEKRCNYD